MAEHTILLVDPDRQLTDRIAAALLPYGCKSVALADQNAVLTYPLVPSLIVLCIDPKRQGWQVANALRKHPVLRAVPLIVTSAEATEADFEQHRKLKWRADEYERKPLGLERIVDEVRALLGGLEIQVSGEFELPMGDEVAVVEEEPDGDASDSDSDGEERTRVASPADMAADLLGADTDAAFA